MNDYEYWIQRKKALDKKALVAENKVTREISKEYNKTLSDVQGKISQFYAQYGKNNIIEYTDLVRRLPTSELRLLYEDFDALIAKHPEYAKLFPVRKKAYALNRLEALQVDVLKSMSELGMMEEQLVKEFLQKQYEMGYLQTLDDLEGVMNISRPFNGVNQNSLKFALKNQWIDGKNYSGRIWEQKSVLSNYLVNEFKTGVAQGKSIHDMSKIIESRFGKSKYVADRLVRTESNYILNESEMNVYEDEGIQEYEYLAAIDERTSDICRGLNGLRFKVKDRKVGINVPPTHPFCRSTTVPATGNAEKNENEPDDKKKYEDTKEAFKSYKLNNIESEYRKEIDEAFLDCANRYPVNTKSLSIKEHSAKSSFGRCRTGFTTSNKNGVKHVNFLSEINLNKIYMKNKVISDRTHLSTYKARGSKLESGISTVYHEYAHFLDNQSVILNNPGLFELSKKLSSNPIKLEYNDIGMYNNFNRLLTSGKDNLSNSIWDSLKTHYNYSQREMLLKVRSELGSYASSDVSEFLAEGFANMNSLPDNKKTEFIKLFEEEFNKEYKRKLGGK